MGLVIRKKVSLEFLGEEYKDGYLVFSAIPVKDLVEIDSKMPKDDKNLESINIILDILKKYFISGESPDNKGALTPVEVNDLDKIDSQTAIHCFQTLSGQDPNLDNGSESSLLPSTKTE